MIFGLLDRYLARAILMAGVLVLGMLIVLAGIFTFISELEDVGKGSYTVAGALYYVLLTLPGKAYLLFPPAVLLGSLLGLGGLAGNSELTVMRAAGVSNARIIRSVLVTGVGLMVLMALLGETLVPRADQKAEELRLTALEKRLSSDARGGFWIRSGKRYINIGAVLPDFTLLDIDIHEVGAKREIVNSIHVDRARPEGDQWRVEGIRRTAFNASQIVVQQVDEERWAKLVNAEVLQSLSVDPESLPARTLLDQVRYLKDNALDSRAIELAFWVKITGPLATLVMLMLSLPFVFGSQRSGGTGQKIFIGIMLGIVYVLVNKLLTQLGLNYGLPAWLSAVFPLAVFLGISLIGIRRSA